MAEFYNNFVQQKRILHDLLISFVQIEDDGQKEYQNLINYLELNKITKNRSDFQEFIFLISSISKNHHRNPSFLKNIERIILFLKDDIKNTFCNHEIYNIFKNNKRILLFLSKEDLLNFDDTIYLNISQKNDLTQAVNYFQSELEQYIQDETDENVAIDNFEEKRQIGENDSYICKIIRSDSIDEFQSYISKTNLSIQTTIEKSIFETNPCLITHNPTLIEYAAFFGSINIFKFLLLKDADLNPSLWTFAVHSNNPEIIHLLESNKIEPIDKNYQQIFKEAIKCHHNSIAQYIKDNYINENDDENFDENEYAFGFHYHNYAFFPDDLNNHFIFYYACLYNYPQIVTFLLKTKEVDYNAQIIFILKF